MKKIPFYIVYSLVWLTSLLPLGILYRISDLTFVLIYWVFRYRREVVLENLSNAFPEKTEKEKRIISRKFFLHLCDYFFETIKLLTISEKEISRRIEYDNSVFKKYCEKNQNTIGMLGHNANWEWFTAVCTKDDFHWAVVYHPLRSSSIFDQLMIKIRSRFGPEPVPMKNTFRRLMELKRSGQLFIAGMVADQSPPNPNNRHWITFLNQDTPVMEGSERIARKIGASVVYGKMTKKKRGYYKVEMIPITDNIDEEEDFSITKKYFQLLEEQIKVQPEYWLWSHRRWKRKRPTDSKLVRK